ncbi:pyridoxamine 5'-phosphate oxidase family protein [Jiangella ureilytica]|uniref:pyridoxamine 5'-phosphate oxidase family protein n=1 Tax=Jiangella ureilytica TaxID=2530374 RepID=UPI00193EBBFB|nr:pyridoxamine 5'-phosphate oxidase family protein [Jiangella ureilytica]
MDPLTRADSDGLEQLDRQTCYDLLSRTSIGRLVFTQGALPAIEPVRFSLDGHDVVVRAEQGLHLPAASRMAVVAFEADAYDEDTRTGWCVVLIGRSRADGDRVRIMPEIVRGRRIRSLPLAAHQDTAVG